ncbi:hypothetical protein NL108_011464 [Boleophthalmus pectinirostris]|uniref:THAP domain-containing protein 8-like n=1 Tax=Boleophthalmus pectinirostris TaxID=150288 RepID=UPI00242B08DB|nr:THAP domain-containing protein 8-like [Boleophthalmus pectinirostris]XP_055013238.1 THAP domain-containing protein 8-like [Boleophthalmus pectinirostris]XP_055013239.1 THAP domain-containing protein 8-like [Boleophthalmus pectinirostris]XP_055013240.1 THAP domain-containing protein 8-like [Boleophthalmus pectinirostris]KAJ0055173.1 hypothetical protein NL108_011464 [Boleophthalmus pectinirostris]
MVNQCSFNNCENKARKWTPQSFHHFPLKDKKRLKLWLRAAGLDPDTPRESLRNRMICSDHFSPADFTNSRIKPFLKPTAVPAVFSRAPITSDEEEEEEEMGQDEPPGGAVAWMFDSDTVIKTEDEVPDPDQTQTRLKTRLKNSTRATPHTPKTT